MRQPLATPPFCHVSVRSMACRPYMARRPCMVMAWGRLEVNSNFSNRVILLFRRDNIWPPTAPPAAVTWGGGGAAKHAWPLWCTNDEQAFVSAVLALNKVPHLRPVYTLPGLSVQLVAYQVAYQASACCSASACP